MEDKCNKCASKAEYICVCIEKHLCDKCLVNHVSQNLSGSSHRPVSLAHPLLTLLMDPEPPVSHPSSNTLKDQITRLSLFKEQSISMVEKKIKTLLQQNQKSFVKKSADKNEDTQTFREFGSPSLAASPLSSRSQFNKSPGLRREDLDPDHPLSSRSLPAGPEVKYKVVLIGDSSVGKKTFMNTFKSFHNDFSKSNSKAEAAIKIESNLFHIDLWNLYAKDKYNALNKLCLYKAAGAIILFDLINEISLMTIEKRIQEFSIEADVLSVIAMVGNKLDLTVKFPKKRFISYEKANEIANSKGMIYDEISANNKQHVIDLLKRILKEIHKRKIFNA
jgi:GTPase SAR1 family protein